MFISRIYSKSVLGLVSLLLLFIGTASSVTYTVYSANQTASDTSIQNNKQIESGKKNASYIQADTNSIRRISLATNDVVYNPSDRKIYVSVPSSVGSIGNSLTQINPTTGEIGSSAFVGSEPNKISLSGSGQTMYVSLDGAGAIRRFDATTQTAGLQFSVGQDSFYGVYQSNDIAASPDNPNVVAVVRYYQSVSPSEAGVAIFDNGVQRPATGPGHIAGSDFVAFGATGATLYGGGYYGGLRTMAVDANGVTVTNTTSYSTGARVKYDNGYIFTSIGQVINAGSKELLGVFSGAVSNAFVSDTAVGRAYYVVRENSSSNTLTLMAYDIATFTPVGLLSIPNVTGDPTSLVRWGANGLAFRTTDNQLFVIQTSLIPSAEPIPTVTPTATPTATPTPFAAFARQISLPTNDLVYNAATQKIYASVPSIAGAPAGNTVTAIDPIAGTIGGSIFVGSEPNKLALADDAQTIYVGLNGAASVRKVDLATQTAGLQFALGNGDNGPATAYDLAAMPGAPSTVAVSRYGGALSIYDQGVQRPLAGNSGGQIAFSSPTTLYSGSGTFTRYSVNASGLSSTSSFTTGGYGKLYFANNSLYSSNGKVVDASTERLRGTFTGVGYDNSIAIDTENNRAFFVTNSNSSSSTYVIRAFELDTFRPVGSVAVQGINGTPTSLVRWGSNGLAFRTTNNQVFLIQTTLVIASETVPTPTPTPTVTPTPTPANIPTFVRTINMPINDVVYNEATQSIYASVASVAGQGLGNTITQINPQTGESLSSTFVGSEPNKLALADDGRTLYTKLDGINAIRRYDAATKTAGLQFSLGGSSQFQDMDVVPGSPQSLAVTVRYDGVSIYDDGVARPNRSNGGAYSINSISFSNSPTTLYGYDSESSGFEFVKFAVNSSGVSGVSSIRDLISGFGVDIKFANGLLYSTTGRVVDPEAQRLLGTFQSGGSAMTIDPVSNRVFYLNNNVLTAYDGNTFVKIGSVTLPTFNGTPTSMVRWGNNGLAIRTASGSSSGPNTSQLILIQSELVSMAVPIPTGIQFGAMNFYSSEGSSNNLITINRTGDLSVASSINYATNNGTATAGEDYTAMSGTLNFAIGESSKTITIPVVNDNIYEGTETFSLMLTNPTANTVLSFPNTAIVNIYDNDSQPYASMANVTVNEPPANGSGVARFNVALTNPTTQTVTLAYTTINGTATAGSDYTPVSGTLTFNPLETVKTVVVPVNGDAINEGDETFFLRISSPVNVFVSTSQVTATIRNFNPQTARPTAFDFDGDAKSDISVFRPDTGTWYLSQSVNGFAGFQFGLGSDKLVPADYDGDRKTDIAVYRGGAWYLQRSQFGFVGINFGGVGDIPQPMDFDGDRIAELAVYRPSNGTWYIFNIATNQISYVQFGTSEDKPVAADYDGDGKADLAVFRPSNRTWYLQRSQAGLTGIVFGEATDKPVVGDYDGDGKSDVAVFRPSNGTWYLQRSQLGFTGIQFGISTDVPVLADYDGDGKADIAVFKPSNGVWYVNQTTNGFSGVQFGADADKPIPNAFVP